MQQTITFKASEQVAARLAELAEDRGLPKGAAIKQLIVDAGPHPARSGGDVPDEAEVMRLLGEAARSGNVTAMKELRAYHRECSRAEQEGGADPFAGLDELAERRVA